MKEHEPHLFGGFGEIDFGKQYRQGNRVYSSFHVATALTANPVGNLGGYTPLYLVKEKKDALHQTSNQVGQDLV